VSSNFGSGSLLYLSIQSTLRSQKELLTSVMSLTVCFAMTANIGLIQNSFHSSIMGWFERSMTPDLTISQGLKVVGGRVQAFAPELLEDLGSDLIKDTAGLQINDTLYNDKSIKIKAFDKPSLDKAFLGFDLQNGPSVEGGKKLFDDENCFISENFSVNFKIFEGDTINLPTPNGNLRTRVVGIVTEYISPIGTIYLNREVYKRHWNDSLISYAFLYSDLESKRPDLKSVVDLKLGKYGLVATENEAILMQGKKHVSDSFVPFEIIRWVILAIAFLGLINATLIRSLNRIKEYGILKAVGMNRTTWIKLLFYETAIQSILTALIASLLTAFVISFWLVKYISVLLGWTIRPELSIQVFAINLAAAFVMSALAALFPILKLKNISTTEIVKNE
jgi:putative ABC transport system permease protein